MGFEHAFYLIDHWLIALAMVGIFVAASEIGFRVGARKPNMPESYRSLVSGISAAMLGLLGLLLAFTLAMAIGRFDARREVVVNESNAIGTLWLRSEFLEEPLRTELRDALLEYTDARIALAGVRYDVDDWRAARIKSERLHTQIWSAVEQADNGEMSPPTLSSLISAANDVIDIHELRLASIENYLPASLLLLLLGVAVVSIYFLAWSFGAAGQGGRMAILAFCLLIVAILFLIMDVNRPRRGMIDVGVETLERVRDSISASPTTELIEPDSPTHAGTSRVRSS